MLVGAKGMLVGVAIVARHGGTSSRASAEGYLRGFEQRDVFVWEELHAKESH